MNNNTPAFGIHKTFLLTGGGKGLAWKTCNIQINFWGQRIVPDCHIFVYDSGGEIFGNGSAASGVSVATKLVLERYP